VIAQETAAALGRALKPALDSDVREHNQAERAPPRSRPLADALRFIVRREACGLRDTVMVVHMYRVPREVHDRMGAIAPRR
jgi:hypothetical protein